MGTTPIYGFPYPDPSDLVANYPAMGQQLAEDIEDVLPTIGGMAPATPTTIANSGGTATLTDNTVTFTTVNSVSLNGCFTSQYTNYRIIFRGLSSTPAAIYIRVRASGADNSSSAYQRARIYAGSYSTGSNEDAFYIAEWNTTQGSVCSIDAFAPQTATYTSITSMGMWANTTTSPVQWDVRSFHNLTNSYDGFSLYPNTGTITGTISVYGYKK